MFFCALAMVDTHVRSVPLAPEVHCTYERKRYGVREELYALFHAARALLRGLKETDDGRLADLRDPNPLGVLSLSPKEQRFP